MPINLKIIKEIDKGDNELLKKVLIALLKKEDAGVYKYKEVYEQTINKYIEEMEKE